MTTVIFVLVLFVVFLYSCYSSLNGSLSDRVLYYRVIILLFFLFYSSFYYNLEQKRLMNSTPVSLRRYQCLGVSRPPFLIGVRIVPNYALIYDDHHNRNFQDYLFADPSRVPKCVTGPLPMDTGASPVDLIEEWRRKVRKKLTNYDKKNHIIFILAMALQGDYFRKGIGMFVLKVSVGEGTKIS